MEKLMELTHSFVTFHYKRVERDPEFSQQAFLGLLYSWTRMEVPFIFTKQQKYLTESNSHCKLNLDIFSLLIDVWDAWIDLYIAATEENPGIKHELEQFLLLVAEQLQTKLMIQSIIVELG